LTENQMAVFADAADRWAEIITGGLPAVELPDGEVVDDIVIEAQGATIDGIGGILGQAGPVYLRPGSLLPAKGLMQFDIVDLANLETHEALLSVIVHEMGHVLGLGTLWNEKGLLFGCNVENPPANPLFLGEAAMAEFGDLLGRDEPTPVPVANTGGVGTRCGHWRESVFGSELMTGFFDLGNNPLSRLTIASMQDLGYAVNLDAADSYELPSALELAIMGIGGEHHWQICTMCGIRRIEPVILPESSLVVAQEE
jgi:hypothetical protein